MKFVSVCLGWRLETGLGSMSSGTSRKPRRMQSVEWKWQGRGGRCALGLSPWSLNRNAAYTLVLGEDRDHVALTVLPSLSLKTIPLFPLLIEFHVS